MGYDPIVDVQLDDVTENELKAKGVVSLATRPNAPSRYGEGGLTAEALKAKFDSLARALADRINNIHNYLRADDLADKIKVDINAVGESGIPTLAALADAIESGEAAKYFTVRVDAEEYMSLQEAIFNILEDVAQNAENIDKTVYRADINTIAHDAALELVFTFYDKNDKEISSSSVFVQNAEYYVYNHNNQSISDGVHPYLVGLIQSNGMHIQSIDEDVDKVESRVETIDKKVENLRAALSPEYFTTDSSVAYTKQIPATALPWAELQEVGGTTNPDGQVGKVTALEIIGTNRLDMSGMLNECLRDNGDGTYTLTKTSIYDRFTASVPLFAPVGQQLYNTFEIVDTNIPNFVNKIPIQMLDESGKTELSSVGIVDGEGGWYTAYGGSVYVRCYLEANYPVGGYVTFRNPMVQFVQYYKAPIAPYAPYRRYTINIPYEVQNLQGYGQGNPTGTEYNYIDYTRRVFVQKGYRDASGAWIPTGREIDISAYLSADNLIEVEGNGSITFVNADKLPVPSKIEYQLKEVTA